MWQIKMYHVLKEIEFHTLAVSDLNDPHRLLGKPLMVAREK